MPVRLQRDGTLELPLKVLGEGGVEVDVDAMQKETGAEQAAEAATETTQAEE